MRRRERQSSENLKIRTTSWANSTGLALRDLLVDYRSAYKCWRLDYRRCQSTRPSRGYTGSGLCTPFKAVFGDARDSFRHDRSSRWSRVERALREMETVSNTTGGVV